MLVATEKKEKEPCHGRPEAGAYPGEKHGKKDEHRDLERLPALIGQYRRHVIGGEPGLSQRQ